jgi:hypothetical protein
VKLALGEAKPTGFLLAEAEIVLQRRKQNSKEKIFILIAGRSSRLTQLNAKRINTVTNEARNVQVANIFKIWISLINFCNRYRIVC